MDMCERCLARERALWRARRNGKLLTSLWDFENWGNGVTEEHHIGRRKFSDLTQTIPRGMHPELTRRAMEEHPPEGPDPDNPMERLGRVLFGLFDMYEGLADAHRFVGEPMIAAAARGGRNLSAVHIPIGLLGWLPRITHDLAKATTDAVRELDKG
jgi:hypothetical protein